jgi:hypothetical protein
VLAHPAALWQRQSLLQHGHGIRQQRQRGVATRLRPGSTRSISFCGPEACAGQGAHTAGPGSANSTCRGAYLQQAAQQRHRQLAVVLRGVVEPPEQRLGQLLLALLAQLMMGSRCCRRL